VILNGVSNSGLNATESHDSFVSHSNFSDSPILSNRILNMRYSTCKHIFIFISEIVLLNIILFNHISYVI